MQAWHTRTAHCLHEEEGLAKHVHLGGCLSGVCYQDAVRGPNSYAPQPTSFPNHHTVVGETPHSRQ